MTPLETLGLPTTATLAEVKVRWRALAGEHHPDRGGDADIFHVMRQAYNEACVQLAEPKKCAACHGTGKNIVVRGFYMVSMPCIFCHGKGQILGG